MSSDAVATMPCAHAIYGSESGLGDYAILAASDGVDAVARDTLTHHASLGGRALLEPFEPFFSYFEIDATRRAFSRTVWLTPTPRGNDYLVHAIVLDAAALARIGSRPFALADAGHFTSAKPRAGALLPLLQLGVQIRNEVELNPAARATVASCLRALARGSLRLRIDDGRVAANVCRVIHDALPPSDRAHMTFCSRFSYGRRLNFRLAAFASGDESEVRAQAGDAVFELWPPAAGRVADAFDRWMAADRVAWDVAGVSLLRDPQAAARILIDIERLRQCAAGTLAMSEDDLRALRPAAQVVMRPENQRLTGDRDVLTGAAVVALWTHVHDVFEKGAPLRDCAAMCRTLEPRVRDAALRAIRQMSAPTIRSWIAEMLLILPHAPLEPIELALNGHAAESAPLVALCRKQRQIYDAFAERLLSELRDRFGSAGVEAAVRVAETLADDRDAVVGFVRAMEAAAAGDQDRDRQVAWLLAIVRDLPRRIDLPPEAAARIILAFDLLPDVDDIPMLERVLPALFNQATKLTKALALVGSPPILACLLQSASRELRRTRWDTAETSALVLALLGGASRLVERGGRTALVARATQFIYHAALQMDRAPNVEVTHAIAGAADICAGAGLSQSEGALLHRALFLVRRGGPLVTRETRTSLESAAWRRAMHVQDLASFLTLRRVRILQMAGS